MLDYEERTQPYDKFVAELRKYFEAEDFPIPVTIVVANIMIENWYLADIEFLSKNKAFLKEKITGVNIQIPALSLKQKNAESNLNHVQLILENIILETRPRPFAW